MPDLNLNYVVAKRAMSLIAQQGKVGYLDLIGVSQEDFNKVTSDVPWLPSDRNRVTSTLNTLLSGVLDSCGLPRFPLPCEYIAAGLSIWVAPGNLHLACSFMERSSTASQLGAGVDEPERCTAQQLFALIVQFHGSDEHTTARIQFEYKTRLKLDAMQEEIKKGKLQNV